QLVVQVVGDLNYEPDEFFHVNLSALFSFNGTAGNEVSFSPDGQPANANLGDLMRGTGLTAAPAPGAFNSTDWTTGATPDPNDYYSFTFTPNFGSPATLTQLVFDGQRDAQGPTTWVVRSSLD